MRTIEDQTLATVKRYKEDSNYILCPHSAIGGTHYLVNLPLLDFS